MISALVSSYNENKVVSWITAILFYLLLYPYFVWDIVGMFQWIVLLPLYVIFFFNADTKKDMNFFVVFILMLTFYSLCRGANLFGYFFDVAISIIFLAKKEFLFSVYRKFWWLYVVFMVMSLLSMVLVLSGIPLPVRSVAPLNDLKQFNYIVYPFWVASYGYFNVGSTRFFGLFDEPGVVGTVSLIMLFIERFNLKKFGNWVILISGILSFSLFFYLAVGFYLVYVMVSGKKKMRMRIGVAVVLGLSVWAVIANPATNERIIERTKWDEEKGSIAGNNRADDALKDYMDQIRWSKDYFLGTNISRVNQEFSNSASLQNAVLRYGIIVVVMYFIFYAFLARKYYHGLNWKWLLFMCFLFMVLYNRPAFFVVGKVFLYNMAIFAYTDEYQQQIWPENKLKKNETDLNS